MPILMMRIEQGFTLGRFKDRYNRMCSIQESLLSTEDAIWLGCDDVRLFRNGMPIQLPDVTATCRMHLTQEMAADLIPLLQHFVDTGELPQPEEVKS